MQHLKPFAYVLVWLSLSHLPPSLSGGLVSEVFGVSKGNASVNVNVNVNANVNTNANAKTNVNANGSLHQVPASTLMARHN